MYAGRARRRTTTLVGYTREIEVARTTLQVPVSGHPIDAVNLKDSRLGLYPELQEFLSRHDVSKGRLRLDLGRGEQHASLTINEYETLLMRHDLAEVLRNPLRFATERARNAWTEPHSVPQKTLDYAKYDFVRTLNRVVDVLGLGQSRIERLMAKAMGVPASRFLRMKRSVSLLVSDSRTPGQPALIEGTYQSPILIQCAGRPAVRARWTSACLGSSSPGSLVRSDSANPSSLRRQALLHRARLQSVRASTRGRRSGERSSRRWG